MARSLDPGFVTDPDDDRWPSDAGWPYPDVDAVDGDLDDPSDPDGEPDHELLSLHGLGRHLLDGLTEAEQAVVAARFGLDGRPARSMKALQSELGIARPELRSILGDALRKLQVHLA